MTPRQWSVLAYYAGRLCVPGTEDVDRCVRASDKRKRQGVYRTLCSLRRLGLVKPANGTWTITGKGTTALNGRGQ